MMRLPKDQLGWMEHTEETILQHAGAERAEDVEIIVTEYGPSPWLKRGIGQLEDPPPHYLQSLDVALYTGLLMRDWIELEIPMAEKHTLIDFDPEDPPEGFTREHKAEQAVIGPKPCFVPSATSSIFRMFTSMMGPTRVNSWVTGNPTKRIFEGTNLASLVPVSSIDEEGNVYLIVINRDRSDEVEAEVRQTRRGCRRPIGDLELDRPELPLHKHAGRSGSREHREIGRRTARARASCTRSPHTPPRPSSSRRKAAQGQSRSSRTNGSSGSWSKSNESNMGAARPSRSVIGAKPWIISMVRSTDEKS